MTIRSLVLVSSLVLGTPVAFASDFLSDQQQRAQLREVLSSPGEFAAPLQDRCRKHSYQNGDKSRFHVDVQSSVCVSAQMGKDIPIDSMGTSLTAQSIGNATILDGEVNLYAAMADARLPLVGSPEAKAEVLVLGYQVWSGRAAAPELDFQRSFTLLNFEKEMTAPFKIGPIPAKVTAGVRARLDTELTGALAFVNARASLEPVLASSGFVQVAVDVLVAEAGVEGNVEFLNERMNLQGAIGVGVDTNPSTPLVFVAGGATGDREFESINGGVKLFAKFKGQAKGYENEFFKFPGTNGREQMFDVKFGPIPLFQKYLQYPDQLKASL